MSIVPFEVPYSPAQVRELRRRLSATRWSDEIDGSNWQYGVELEYLRDMCAYWKDGFNWRHQVAELRKLQHFRFQRHQGLRVHFVHERGRGPAPVPLIITHGWPGSFLEMLKLIPLLTEPDANGFCFDVVIPSLPGFGFSDRPHTPGMSTARIAEMWADLMEALGYRRFAVQGGDFGSGVATFLGLRHSDRVSAIHLNYIPGSYMPPLDGAALSKEEQQFVEDGRRWDEENGAYAHVQRREPQTLGCALNDSPVGLAAWILEKFRLWADCHGDLSKRFTKDEMLGNVMLYWTTQTITSSCRLYYETRHQPVYFAHDDRVSVPCGIAKFPFESPFPPRSWVERGYNVQRWTEMPTGGHFAAMEEPESLAEDIRGFFSTAVAQHQHAVADRR